MRIPRAPAAAGGGACGLFPAARPGARGNAGAAGKRKGRRRNAWPAPPPCLGVLRDGPSAVRRAAFRRQVEGHLALLAGADGHLARPLHLLAVARHLGREGVLVLLAGLQRRRNEDPLAVGRARPVAVDRQPGVGRQAHADRRGRRRRAELLGVRAVVAVLALIDRTAVAVLRRQAVGVDRRPVGRVAGGTRGVGHAAVVAAAPAAVAVAAGAAAVGAAVAARAAHVAAAVAAGAAAPAAAMAAAVAAAVAPAAAVATPAAAVAAAAATTELAILLLAVFVVLCRVLTRVVAHRRHVGAAAERHHQHHAVHQRTLLIERNRVLTHTTGSFRHNRSQAEACEFRQSACHTPKG